MIISGFLFGGFFRFRAENVLLSLGYEAAADRLRTKNAEREAAEKYVEGLL